MNGDESLMASNRTFLNERTDLTSTEISPRLGGYAETGAGTGIDKPTGKIMKINTRVIKLS